MARVEVPLRRETVERHGIHPHGSRPFQPPSQPPPGTHTQPTPTPSSCQDTLHPPDPLADQGTDGTQRPKKTAGVPGTPSRTQQADGDNTESRKTRASARHPLHPVPLPTHASPPTAPIPPAALPLLPPHPSAHLRASAVCVGWFTYAIPGAPGRMSPCRRPLSLPSGALRIDRHSRRLGWVVRNRLE